MVSNIFHTDYREFPYWWEAYAPASDELTDFPGKTQVAIIGAGYAGMATAVELSKLGIEAVVLDAESPGYGASTRSGGLVGGMASVKKPLVAPMPSPEHAQQMTSDAGDGLALLERLIEEEKIECGWHKTGRFTGAWSKSAYRKMRDDAEKLNQAGNANAYVVAPDQQREEIGSDFYHGGLVTEEAGHLHPALYFSGLLNACRGRGVVVCAQAKVVSLQQGDGGWSVRTSRGELKAQDVVIATNGYTGDLTPQFQQRLVALQPYIIATEPLPEELAKGLSPKDRSFADSKRIVTFYRLSSDGRRMIFGSRVKWRDMSPTEMAPLLYDIMVERFPQLADTKVTHAWTGNVALTLDEQPHLGQLEGLHYALGCNGSGVAMMTYMGTQLACKIAGQPNYRCAFDSGDFPTHPFYNGRSRWFLPVIGNYLKMRDWIDRRRG